MCNNPFEQFFFCTYNLQLSVIFQIILQEIIAIAMNFVYTYVFRNFLFDYLFFLFI